MVVSMLGVRDGSKVEAVWEDGRFVITPKRPDLEAMASKIDLEQLLSTISDDNRPDADGWEDAPTGRELW
jgi:antitoxin component of MazEF toxin-antitoxin module